MLASFEGAPTWVPFFGQRKLNIWNIRGVGLKTFYGVPLLTEESRGQIFSLLGLMVSNNTLEKGYSGSFPSQGLENEL